MGECFIWYQPTWVVLDKGLLNSCVCDAMVVGSVCYCPVSVHLQSDHLSGKIGKILWENYLLLTSRLGYTGVS